jgi:hypothetical protein
MPAHVVDDPLAVEFIFPNGTGWTVALDGLPNSRLARDLAIGLAANAHPQGGIGAKNTAKGFGVGLRRMVVQLAQAGFTGSAPELTRSVLNQFWLANNYVREQQTRLILKGYDEATGALSPAVRAHLSGKMIQAYRPTQPYKSYTDQEWAGLEAGLRAVVDDARSRQRAALRGAQKGADPHAARAHTPENIAWLLLRQGPFPDRLGYDACASDQTPDSVWALRRTVRQVRVDLFPTRVVQVAYAMLFGLYSGIVPDGVDDLELGGVEWAGDANVLLTYIKGRTSRESVHLPRRALRALERWLEFSAPLRGFADERLRKQLWISLIPAGNSSGIVGPPPSGKQQRELGRGLGLVDATGAPLVIHRGRIRASYHERLARRGWSGRATIDPNHTARTEGDHYITPTDPAQLDAVESIIEDGQGEILRKARPPVVLTGEQAAAFAESFPDEVGRLGLDSGAVAELVGGERDVFTAACSDQLAGVYGPKGQPCPARPWVCLLCPLAVFLPRHAANLLRLKAFFARQFRQMPAEQFVRVFGPYADRLENEILPKLSADTLSAAALEVADEDGELPLRPEEATV